MYEPTVHPEPYPGDVTKGVTSPCRRNSPDLARKCGLDDGHPGAHAAGDGTYTRAIWTSAGAEWHVWPNP